MRLTSPIGSAILRARITDSVQPGHVFASIHWTGETAPSARIDAVIAAATDPVSGQPESKASVVSVTRFEPAWYGFAVSRDAMKPTSDYWALSRTAQGYRAEMAGRAPVSDWVAEVKRLFGTQSAKVASVLDPNRGIARIALHEDGVLIGALFVSPTPVSVMRDYLQTLPGQKALDALSGRSPADLPNPGPVLCACFGIGINTILDAIETEGLMTVDAIGEALSAGTNCGSCRPELSDLLLSVKTREAAE